MSRVNKANKDRYMQAGRLTPDDMARELRKQREAVRNRVDRPKEGRGGRAPAPRRTGRAE